MRGYGQFCPVAKASEILAERWTPLVLRELLCGSTRFNDLLRGVPLMSKSLLSKRLGELERAGIVERRVRRDRPGPEYVLTPAGEELRPVVEALGRWGQRWVVTDVEEDDLDPSLLMWDIRRNLRREELPDGQVVIRFEFPDVPGPRRRWWLLAAREGGDLCMTDPGFEVDVRVRSGLRPLTRFWLGQVTWKDLAKTGDLEIEGPPWARRDLPKWLGRSTFADVPRP